MSVALFTAASLLVSPIFAQVQQAQSQNAEAQGQLPSQPQAQTVRTGPVQARQVTLGTDYSKAKGWLPNPIAPYAPSKIAGPALTNSRRIDQLIQNGKLMLSLEDAISLALEDNLAIAVERYTPWLDQVNLLRAKSGVNGPIPFDPT